MECRNCLRSFSEQLSHCFFLSSPSQNAKEVYFPRPHIWLLKLQYTPLCSKSYIFMSHYPYLESIHQTLCLLKSLPYLITLQKMQIKASLFIHIFLFTLELDFFSCHFLSTLKLGNWN